MRRTIIGAIGGDEEDAGGTAVDFGSEVARAGCILLTGGAPCAEKAVKNATMRGAVESGAVARLIGFLPTCPPREWRRPTPTQLLIGTGLSSTKRNGFNGLTPDVMVVFKGSRGTLTELAFAWVRGTPVFLWSSLEYLEAKRKQHGTSAERIGATPPRESQSSLDKYIEDAWSSLPRDAQVRFQPKVVRSALDAALTDAREVNLDAERLVALCVDCVGGLCVDADTGFPGFQEEPSSKREFENIVRQISI